MVETTSIFISNLHVCVHAMKKLVAFKNVHQTLVKVMFTSRVTFNILTNDHVVTAGVSFGFVLGDYSHKRRHNHCTQTSPIPRNMHNGKIRTNNENSYSPNSHHQPSDCYSSCFTPHNLG